MNIAEIRERWCKGTPGPWEVNDQRDFGWMDKGVYIFKPDKKVGNFARVFQGEHPILDDANKIAHAPDDIAFLLALVERLEGMLSLAGRTFGDFSVHGCSQENAKEMHKMIAEEFKEDKKHVI